MTETMVSSKPVNDSSMDRDPNMEYRRKVAKVVSLLRSTAIWSAKGMNKETLDYWAAIQERIEVENATIFRAQQERHKIIRDAAKML